MKYAIIQLNGKQYRISEGDQITVDRLDESSWKNGKMTVSDVLLSRNDSDIKVGAPFVDGAKVALELVENNRGPKLRIFQYKAKSRYRRRMGFRPSQTIVKVASITA